MRNFSQPRYEPTTEIDNFVEEGEKVWNIVEEYEPFSLKDLVEEFSSIPEDSDTKKIRERVLKAYIIDKLGLATKGTLQYYDEWFMHEELVPKLKKMNEEINELKTHRHKVANGLYSEKPAW